MSLVQQFLGSKYSRCIIRRNSNPNRQLPAIAKGKASLGMESAPVPYVVVDCDMPPFDQNAARCDYIFVSNGKVGFLCPVEMTSGEKKASDAVKQLQASADLASQGIGKVDVSAFQPILVGALHERRRDVKGLRQAPRQQVRFRGRAYQIKSVVSGSRLVDAVDAAQAS